MTRDRRARRRHRDRHPRRAPDRRPRRRRPQPHVPRGDRGHEGGDRARRGRPPPAVGDLDRPLVARPLGRGPGGAAPPDAVDRPPDRGLERDRPQGRRRGPDRGAADRSSTTASTSTATTTRSRAARCARSTAWSRRRRSSAWSAGWSWRRATRRCSRRGRSCWRPCPSAYLLIVGEGSRLDALHDIARATGDRAPRGVHRPPRRHPGRHRGLRRRGPAVLPRGAGADDPRGDGAVASGRRLERRRDPGDDRGRRHRAARPAAGSRRRWPRRSCGS